ncbi:MAG TPA: hypothetical protein VGH58_04810 [Solirubrobacterales bacterium]
MRVQVPPPASQNGRLGSAVPQGRACVGCPDEPWVVLCDLEVSGGEIVDLKCEPHRRYVVSFADYAFACPKS